MKVLKGVNWAELKCLLLARDEWRAASYEDRPLDARLMDYMLLG